MGNRHPANEHGIPSAGVYLVCRCWLFRLFVRSVAARRQLVSCAREAWASPAVWSDYSGSYSYVFAGSLCSIVDLRPLFSFFSSLTFNLNGGRNRLACKI